MSNGTFARVLRAPEVVTLSFGAMIGWSWVLLTGHWVETAGSLGTLAAFAIGGVAIVLIGLLYSELASAMPHVGGEHVYTHRALGPKASFVCTWALLMSYSTVCVFESVALPTAVEYLVPEIRFLPLWTVLDAPVYLGFVVVGIAGAVAMTGVNLLGIRVAARVQLVVTVVIVLSGVLLMTGAVSAGEVQFAEPLFADGIAGVMVVLIMVPALLVGFDVIPQSAEEIDLHPRRIGTLLVVSVIVAVLWYGMISFSVALGLSPTARPDAAMATADAASALWGTPNAGAMLVLGGIGGILTSWNAFLIGGSRVMYALAKSGMLPAVFTRMHPKYKTPYVAVLTIGALSCLSPFFGRTILVWLVNAGSFAIVICYFFVALAYLALRRNEPALPRPFSVRWPRLVGFAAAGMALGLFTLYLPWSPSALSWPYEWLMVGAWAGVGGVLYVTHARHTD